jgi:hypothetical protein
MFQRCYWAILAASDGSQSSLRLDREFLVSVALFTVDRTLSHPPHLFNGIEVSAIGRTMKIKPETVTQTALCASFAPLPGGLKLYHPGKSVPPD